MLSFLLFLRQASDHIAKDEISTAEVYHSDEMAGLIFWPPGQIVIENR